MKKLCYFCEKSRFAMSMESVMSPCFVQSVIGKLDINVHYATLSVQSSVGQISVKM